MPDSCGMLGVKHKWVEANGSHDLARRKLMNPEFGPWYQCTKCGFATSALFQEPGWTPNGQRKGFGKEKAARARRINESISASAFPQAERLYPTD